MKRKKIITAMLIMALGILPAASGLAADIPHFDNNKSMVEYFWNEVFNKHNPTVIDAMTSASYTQHSPGFADGQQAFKDGITGFLKEFPDSTAEIKHIGADGDLVFIHNHIKLNATDRGQAAVDIFRVKNGRIVEHWDVIQDIPEKAENTNTMF